MQSRGYSIACGISREARRLRSINHTSLWLGAWTPTPRTRTARSAACRCNCGAHRPRIIWVPPIPVSTATGVASSSTSRRARRLWNSSPQRSRRARFLPSACLSLSPSGEGTFMLHAWASLRSALSLSLSLSLHRERVRLWLHAWASLRSAHPLNGSI